MLPLVLGATLLTLAILIAATSTTSKPRRAGTRRPTADPGIEAWAHEVLRRLPAAFDAQNVSKAGPDRKGTRPRPRVVGDGIALEQGWRYSLNLPGNSEAADWDPNRIAAALNAGDRLAAAAEIGASGNGWADLSVWRRDPLDGEQPVPWRPGSMPTCVRPGSVCVGRRRDGQHIHFDIIRDGSALATLIAGRRGSGKSETARLVVAQMCAWEWAPPIVVDLVRHGVDYAVFAPLLDRPIITNPKDAAALVVELNAEADERAEWMRARGVQKIARFTPERPARPLIWDEVQTATDDKKLNTGLRRWTQQARPVGGAPVLVTQYPTVQNLDSTLRAQIANAWCGRVRNHVEAGVVFGPLPEGVGPHLLRTGPGSCVVDSDGPSLDIGRTWHASDAWLRTHVDRLAKVKV